MEKGKCKNCCKEFKSILGHINNKKNVQNCKDKYNSDEIDKLRRESKDRRNTKRRQNYDEFEVRKRAKKHNKTYDSSKRKERYLKSIRKDTDEIEKSGKFHQYEMCKGCKQIYLSIFGHLRKSDLCKGKYSQEELDQIKKEKYENASPLYLKRKLDHQRHTYDAKQRKKRYEEKKM